MEGVAHIVDPLEEIRSEIHVDQIDGGSSVQHDNGSVVAGAKIRMDFSPGSTQYWIPECEQQITPCVGMMFPDLEAGMQFYKKYGSCSGFDVRISTTRRFRNGVIRTQRGVCNREGFKNGAPSKKNVGDCSESNGGKRQRLSKRVGCKAHVGFEYVEGKGYTIKVFEEKHNHVLSSKEYRLFLKANRKLNFGHQKFIIDCTKANIGPAKTHRLYKEMVGGYANAGALQIDFKNFKRELKAYVCGADAQLVINRFLKKLEVCPGMAFNYDVDENGRLTRLFWADPIARKNYSMFGDVVSFDATYSTNRYKMVFTPFTGVDNHKKCITFAAGLIVKEDEASYVWLFENFMKAMGREPHYMVTDQDPAMKKAFKVIFKTARQRLCMWHIMQKVSAKVGNALANNENFVKRLNDIVWSEYIEPAEFEEKWKELMNDFGLSTHSWFSTLFDIRKYWIPAYFRDANLGGLLRTTSRSESANSWFGHFTTPQSNLVEFFMFFDSAMDSQRHNISKLNSECESSFPECTTPLIIERHAASMCTNSLFSEVRIEIEAACYKCVVLEVVDQVDKSCYTIKDSDHGVFDVISHKHENVAHCSCKMFERVGLLCRHIFMIFKALESIPDTYLITRWMKGTTLNSAFAEAVSNQLEGIDEGKAFLNKLWSDFHSCVLLAEGDKDRLVELSRVIADEKKSLLAQKKDGLAILSKQNVIESFVGSTSQLDVTVLPPEQANNKGSGSRVKHRIQSQQEKAVKASAKLKRRCGKCGEVGTHNSRTCKGKS